MALTEEQVWLLAALATGGVAAVLYFILKPPAPPPPGTGRLKVHAYYDMREVSATVEIVELEKEYTTPFTVDVDPGTYALNAAYADLTQSETATVTAGETTRVDFRFAAPVGYTVMVKVKDSTGGVVEGAEVFIDGASVGVTDEDGYIYPGVNVMPGDHTFRAEKSGYRPTEKTVNVYRDMTVVLILTPIVATYTVTVKVADAETLEPIPSATVGLDGYGGWTDADGFCVISDVPEGTYHVSAGKSGYYATGKDISVTHDTYVPLVLTPIPPETAHVRVGVMDITTYLPVHGARVVMDGYEAVTDGGHVDFYDVPYGTYTATASKAGYVTNSVTVVVDSTYVSPGIWLTPT